MKSFPNAKEPERLEDQEMNVKIGNKIYDGSKIPIMVILDEQDKHNIGNIESYLIKYCVYPRCMTNKEAFIWMKKTWEINYHNYRHMWE